jgi:hypothetical protein
MTKGKYKTRAENQEFANLQLALAKAEQEIAELKHTKQRLQKDLLRLSVLEKLVDESGNLSRRLMEAESKLSRVDMRNIILEERLQRWSKVFMNQRNIDEMLVPNEVFVDLADMGMLPVSVMNNRSHRRNLATAQKASAAMRRNHGTV